MTLQPPMIRCFTPGVGEDVVRAALAPLDAIVQYTDLGAWEAAHAADGSELVLWYVAAAEATFGADLRRLRAGYPEAPLIILAEPAAEPQAAEALDAGVTDYVLATPPQLRRLPRLVQRAIEQRRLQDRLQAADAEVQLARRAMAAVNDGLVLVDMERADSPLIYCNPAFTRITGYTLAEVSGHNCRFLQGPDTDPEAIEQIRQALRQRQPCHAELLNYRRDGAPFWNELSLAPVFGKDGELTHYIGTQRDVTERRRTAERLQREFLARQAAEESLRAAEAHYRMLVEHLPIAISTVVLDDPGATPYVSPQIEGLLGFTPEEWIGQTNLRGQQTHPDDVARVAAAAAQAGAQGRIQIELRMFHREGHVVWIEYGQQIVDVDGRRVLLATIGDITRRKAAEEALRESNERYDLAVHGSSDGIWDWKVAADQVYFSPRFRALIGHALEGPLDGMESLVAVVHPDDLERTTGAITAHLSGGAPFKVEYRLRTASGEYRWFLVRGQAIWDAEGRPVRMAGSLTDIHDGMVAQQEIERLNRTLEARIAERTVLLDEAIRSLQESEHRLRTVVANAPILLFSFDRAGTVTLAEGRGLAQIGLEPQQLVGQSIFDLNSEAPEMLANIERVLTGETLEAIYEVAGAAFETRYIPLLNDAGAITGAISVSVDITARRRAEEELARSLKYARSVTDTSPDIVYIYDLIARQNVSSNRAIERILGYTPEQIRAMGDTLFPRLMHPDDLAALPAHREAVLRLPDGAVAEFEYRMRAADGSWRWLFGRDVIFQRLADNSPHLTLGVVSDITRRKRAEQALQERSADLAQANAALARVAQLKDEFLASMSHELRTPLNAILGRSELLQEELQGPLTERQRQSLVAIEEAGRHLLALISDILDLSKIEASRLILEPEPVSLHDICQSAIRMVAQTALQKGLRLSLRMEQSVEQIEGDPRRLKQILVNLLSNAVKFTPEGGQVSLILEDGPQRGHLTFTVSDTGIGISPDDQSRLFQPFVQIDSSLSRQHNGTGLGLALVMRLARLHNGSVALQSVPGEGSSFSVSLPVAQPATVARPEPEGRSHGPPAAEAPAELPGRQRLILLADDNQANTELLKDYLRVAGYEVVCANNGLEAVAYASELHPALILMDIQMPLLDGIEAIRRIRDRGDSATPIIALTALAMRGDRERCLAAGASAYVTKPVNLRTLLSLIGSQLDQAGQITV